MSNNMEKFFRKKAFDFIYLGSQGDRILSALDYFGENITPFINDNSYQECLDIWFSILINEHSLIDEAIKKLVIFSIDDNDIFVSSKSDEFHWETLKTL